MAKKARRHWIFWKPQEPRFKIHVDNILNVARFTFTAYSPSLPYFPISFHRSIALRRDVTIALFRHLAFASFARSSRLQIRRSSSTSAKPANDQLAGPKCAVSSQFHKEEVRIKAQSQLRRNFNRADLNCNRFDHMKT
ncbi:hypothetical protein L596_014892 [Steinernema carpocapsae]|uniref:Uncharacterized protein n=1 Tax=Steinernema carpocapsae TaxID=34508 RepID=A0A4U5NE44_STECR|nr:hypothetical protein L596_014892 [Steinernema carpocapsae]